MNRQVIIFTDLDGTLLDAQYSFEKAMPALRLIKEKKISLILCSSKTRSEIERCRVKIDNAHPFISENGGGIFVPRGYFELQITNYEFQLEEYGDYFLIRLGAPYDDLRRALQELRSEGFAVKGFGDMTVKEVADLTGLETVDAEFAKQRDFDEPFVFTGSAENIPELKRSIKAKGFNYTQGEFYHIMGDSDKGRAVEIVKSLYAGGHEKLITIALGDSPNDIEMLRSVDYPVVVQKKDGSYDNRIDAPNLMKADGVGPEGWNRAVLELLNKLP
jgi:mannosyl-3-phosphoglycerate phosphatase